jgi:iron complex transport system permease protein
VPALIGAASVLLIVVSIAAEGRRLSSFTLLLAGVTMNSICFAIILFIHNLASFSQSFAISRWLMGGLDAVEYSTLAWLAAAIVPITILVLYSRAAMEPALGGRGLGGVARRPIRSPHAAWLHRWINPHRACDVANRADRIHRTDRAPRAAPEAGR